MACRPSAMLDHAQVHGLRPYCACPAAGRSTHYWGVLVLLLQGYNCLQARIQDLEGGGSYIQKGGFRTGISGGDPNCCRALGKSTSKKKIADSRRGGGGVPMTQKKPCIRAWSDLGLALGEIIPRCSPGFPQ